MENPKATIPKVLKFISKFSKIATQELKHKSLVCLCSRKKKIKTKIHKSIQFTIA